MNLEDPDHEQLEIQRPRDPPRTEEAALRAKPGLATTTFAREREPPPGGTWRFATTGKHDQAMSGVADITEDPPALYSSPVGSDSGSSMSGNFDDLIPSGTPPQAGSPGPATGFEGLSLDNSRSYTRAQAQRGRISVYETHPASRRAAGREVPRRKSPDSPVPTAAQRWHYLNSAAGSSRHKATLGTKRHVTRAKLTNQYESDTRDDYARKRIPPHREYVQHGDVRSSFDAHRHATTPRQRVGRDDSGYETMPSRQATLQHGMTAAFDQQGPTAPCLEDIKAPPENFAPIIEEPRQWVIQLPGSVPVVVDSRYPEMYMQPKSSPISQDQLAAEVKGIYGGLVMVEAKCINIDAAQAADPTSTLGPEQWQALIALHRTLLYEHHDFLMATQHPSATPALSDLAQKYSMPARMWRHAIHAFLEVLRHRRPQSQDYMLSFIYLAYQMMALLFETVPAFTDTWIECLGDLARYRMAIEEEKESHSIWGGVAARWYSMASDRHFQIGRLYHHLGILERPSLRKLFLYAKSLNAMIPFPNAKDSLHTLCNSIIQGQQSNQNGIAPAETSFVTYYAYLFSTGDNIRCSELSTEALSQLSHQPSSRLRDTGVPLLVTNIAALFQLGIPSNQLSACFTQSINLSIHSSRPSTAACPTNQPENSMDVWPIEGTFADEAVYDFCYSTFETIMYRGKDRQSLEHVLPSVHVILVWIHGIYSVQSSNNALDNTINSLFTRFAWQGLCDFLNTLLQYECITDRLVELANNGIVPGSNEPLESRPRPLSEDYMIRGLIWCHWYFNLMADWFNGQSEDDGRFFETSAMRKARVERVFWLALFLALRVEWFTFDKDQRLFCVSMVPPSNLSNLAVSAVQRQQKKNDHSTIEDSVETQPSKSRSLTTLSTHSDSEGYTVVNTSKSKLSYAQAASSGYDGVLVIDDDDVEMQTAT